MLKKEKMDIPLCINTIENCFCNICIIGNNSISENLFKYLSENERIQVSWIRNESGEFYVADDVEIAIFTCDFTKSASTKDGKKVYSISYKKLLDGQVEDCFFDIYNNILSKLMKSGVEVFAVLSPDLREYNRKISLYFSMLFYRIIVKYSSMRDYFVLRHLGELELFDEFMQTKSDKSKGYARVFGNGNKINYDDGFRRIQSDGVNETVNRLFMFGFCISANPMLPDNDTIGTNLQKLLQDRYTVLSRGNDGASINLVMREQTYKKGDIVVLFTSHKDKAVKESGANIINLTSRFCKIGKLWKHIADSSFHCDSYISRMIASELYESISKVVERTDYSNKYDEFQLGNYYKRLPSINMVPTGIKEYINDIKRQAVLSYNQYDFQGICGCVVMNCNPFTLGHQYLIDVASKKVDYLYVFVVQEDKSDFPFAERFKMVKKGTEIFTNVGVFSSGNFMISSSTLPGYFDKKHLGNIEVSANDDLEIFAVIAKELNIQMRFAGEEPNDGFTNKYNQAMKSLLPRYGIEFIEIPRKRVQGNETVISATYVRKHISDGNVEEVKKLLPLTTITILKERGYIRDKK